MRQRIPDKRQAKRTKENNKTNRKGEKNMVYDKRNKHTTMIRNPKISYVEIEKMEILPDHIHLFVKGDPTSAPHWIVQQFKGYTSRMLRQKFSFLRTRLPTLWTRSYYCESVGHISEATVRRYIEEQKGK